MALFGDLNELKQEWKDSGPLKKGLIILVLFLTTSSLTSLSDAVFKWKGFILEGIKFYREYVQLPILSFFEFLSLDLNSQETDYLILFVLMASGILRTIVLQENRKKENTRGFNVFSISFMTTFLLVVAFFLLDKTRDYQISPFFGLILPFGMSVLVTTVSLTDVRGPSEKTAFGINETKDLLVLWGPLLFASVVVLVLGAINSGLSRPA